MFLAVLVVLSLTSIGDVASGSCQLQCTKPESYACRQSVGVPIAFISDNGDLHPKAAGDGADAWSNIQAACNGYRAKRSTNCCHENGSSACAPGGSVCIDLVLINNYLWNNLSIIKRVVSIAGGCHLNSPSSYKGSAIQVLAERGQVVGTFITACNNFGGVHTAGPEYQSVETFYCTL